MNFRLTAIFFAVVLTLVGLLLAVVLFDTGDPAALTADGLLAPFAKAGVKEKDVDTVELTRTSPSEETLVFVRVADGKWELRQPFTAKVEGFAIDGIVRDLFRAKPIRYAELTDSLTVHGLDQPSLKVTLRKGAEHSATINLGDSTIGGGKGVTFVTTGAAPKTPLAVTRSDLGSLFRDSAGKKDGPAWELAKWLPDYRIKKLLGADYQPTDAQAVKLTTGGKELSLTRAASGAWTFASPAGWGEADDLGDSVPAPATAPLTGVRPLITALTALQTTGPDDYIEKPDDLAKYGLKSDDPAVLRIELKGKTGGPEILFLGKAVEENGKSVVPPKVYARLDGDSAVIKLATDKTDALKATVATPGDLRNKDIIASTKKDKIDAIDVTVGTSTIQLRKLPGIGEAPGPWQLYGGPADPQDARRTEVDGLIKVLASPRAASVVLPAPDDAAFAPAEVKAVVKIWLDGVVPGKAEAGKPTPPPTLKGNPIELTFGKRDGTGTFVRRKIDGASTDFKVPDSAYAAATRPRLDYVDPKLKSFVTQQAGGLKFNRGADAYDLTKPTDPIGAWPFAAPAAKKGQNADPDKVYNILGLLAGLFIEKVVSEAPSPDDLKKWGLDPARLKVTVPLTDDPAKERVYEFGADADVGKTIYCRQAGSPVVFTVARLVFDRIATDDLRDPVVYRLDIGKVKKVKLRGWKGLTGNDPLVYQFEKGPAGWTAIAPTPAGFAVDGLKLNSLLGAVAAPRADAFVAVGAKPEFGLDVATNPDGMEITIELDGAATVTLVLGSKADGGKVFAASSGVPGEVFTLNPAAIRTYTEKPAALQK